MPTTVDTADLHPDFSDALNKLIAGVKAAGGNPQVTSGYRSKADQQYIIDHPETHGSNPVAPAGSSLHEKGLAADVTGDPKTVQLLHSLAPQYGLAFPYGNDPVHVQFGDKSKNVSAGVATTDSTGGTTVSTDPQPIPLDQRLNILAGLFNGQGTQPDTNIDASTTVGAPSTGPATEATTGSSPTDPNANPFDGTLTPSNNSAAPAATKNMAPSGNYASLFNEMGQKYGIDPALLSAVAKQESGFNPNAKSGVGAVGLMQLMPGTAHSLGVDPSNPIQAVDGAARMLSGFMKQYNGDLDKTLAAYNAGPGAVAHYNGVPPYQETQNYVKSVKANMGAGGGND